MGKSCCKSCPGSSCCGCCCSKRMATTTFSVIGLAFSVVLLIPPIYVYSTDQDYKQLFPWIKFSKDTLKQMIDYHFGAEDQDFLDGEESMVYEEETTKMPQVENGSREKYKLALFQLLDDIELNAKPMAIFSFAIGCINIPIHVLLLAGAACKSPCLMLPWLAITLLEHLVVGVPLIVFFGIISLYLATQLNLYLVAGAVISSIVMLFILSLSSWFTVHACYNEFYNRQDYYYESVGQTAGNSSAEATQPLLPSASGGGGGGGSNRASRTGPALPPGHPNGYQLGQYPQYYPPHLNQSRQLPSAPPSSTGIYPHLPNA